MSELVITWDGLKYGELSDFIMACCRIDRRGYLITEVGLTLTAPFRRAGEVCCTAVSPYEMPEGLSCASCFAELKGMGRIVTWERGYCAADLESLFPDSDPLTATVRASDLAVELHPWFERALEETRLKL